MSRCGERALAVAGGLALHTLLPEPQRWHPVGWFGSAMQHVEEVSYADSRAAGTRYAAVGVLLGWLAGRRTRSVLAAVTLSAAGRELRLAALRVETPLVHGDLTTARRALPALVGRETSSLDASGIAAAVIESLAENSVDAVVAPACWGLALGAPGVLAHRAINTMDAMVGHHTERYENFGWAAARLDDAANWLPARLFAALVAVSAGRGPRAVLTTVRRDAPRHPSPNAGVAEAAVAAALHRELGGPLQYGNRYEDRPRLGAGPRPDPTDLHAARTLTARTERVLIAGLVAFWWADRCVGSSRRSVPCR